MAKIDCDALKQKFTDEVYDEHITLVEVNPDETKQRFIAWVNLYGDSLLDEYIARVKAREKISMKLGHYDWLRQMFIVWDYNRTHQTQLEDEINSLIS